MRRNHRTGRVAGGRGGEAREDLLFYRFAGLDARADGGQGAVFDEVRSVIAEVTLLLNTRSVMSPSLCGTGARISVLEYGLADFLHLSPRSRADAQVLACRIRETVNAHEPRLLVESVTVDAPRPCRDVLSVVIAGQVRRRDGSAASVCFPVKVGVPG